MKSSAGLRFKTYLLILIMVIFGPVGDVLLREGMRRTGKLTTWAPLMLVRRNLPVTSGFTSRCLRETVLSLRDAMTTRQIPPVG